jgi:hypothetical protein
MRKIVFAATLAASLAACGTTGGGGGNPIVSLLPKQIQDGVLGFCNVVLNTGIAGQIAAAMTGADTVGAVVEVLCRSFTTPASARGKVAAGGAGAVRTEFRGVVVTGRKL